MDGTAWISLVAAAVALGAMVVAIWQASEARGAKQAAQAQAVAARDSADATEVGARAAGRSASAAEQSAAEAAKANAFVREKDERELKERDEAAVNEARKVTVERNGSGGVWIHIVNSGGRPIRDVELLEVVPSDDPTWRWEPNDRVPGSRGPASMIQPGGRYKWPIVFRSPAGKESFFVGQRYDVTFRFTDSAGVGWRRINDDIPMREDELQSAAELAQTPLRRKPFTEADFRFELLTLLAGRLERNEAINVRQLPADLNQDEELVQRCLRHLRDDGHIEAMHGDDMIMSIHEVTNRGIGVLERGCW